MSEATCTSDSGSPEMMPKGAEVPEKEAPEGSGTVAEFSCASLIAVLPVPLKEYSATRPCASGFDKPLRSDWISTWLRATFHICRSSTRPFKPATLVMVKVSLKGSALVWLPAPTAELLSRMPLIYIRTWPSFSRVIA